MTVTDNIEVILEIAKEIIVHEKRNDFVFVLLGDGDVRSKMEKLAIDYNICNNIEFQGMVDYQRVMEYLFIADVCIAPDLPNGLNEHLTLIKILEYMKAKKPFVAFDFYETKTNGGRFWIVCFSNIIDYKNKISITY